MKAARLVSMILLLQTRGRLTARQLADELEVSVRTVFRDVDSLSAAGVPVATSRGPAGGIELLDGYQTRLTGLSLDEAFALLLGGSASAAPELGLADAAARAGQKLLEALPEGVRDGVQARAERFLDDPEPGPESGVDSPVALLAQAVREERVVRAGAQPAEQQLEPLALARRRGRWYVIARVHGETRTYPVAGLASFRVTRERFERPPDFDLRRYWNDWVGGARRADAAAG
ncbi:MAG: WYL domain-containing protein [Myxococcota bacterium]|nr:WYL domain-containing protein [Myxococcota bacterium]